MPTTPVVPAQLTISGLNGTANVGDTLSFTPTISGGTAPYNVTATGLPPGRSINNAATGLTTGAYTNAGSFNATYTVTDSGSPQQTASFTRTVAVSAASTGQAYDLNFASQSYQTPTGTVPDPISAGLLSINRASDLAAPDSTGRYSIFAAGTVARNDLGWWLRKDTRKQSIVNSSMTGAVIGNPGTLPTGWTVPNAAPSGITIQVAATGAADPDKGLPYIDLDISGTAGANGNYTLQFGPNAMIAATGTSRFMLSAWLAVVSGTKPNDGTTAVRLGGQFANSVNTAQGSQVLSADSLMNRDTTPRRLKQLFDATTLTSAQQSAVALFKGQLQIAFKSGTAYSYRVRLIVPQGEAVSAATDDASAPILTTNAAVTANADTLSLAGGTLAFAQGAATTLEATTTALRGSGLDYRDERTLITVNGSIKALKRTADGRLASELAGAPRTAVGSYRTQYDWTQTHAVAWDASGAKVAGTSPALATPVAAGSVPAISSVSLDVNGCLQRIVIRNTAADLSAYNQISADVIQYGATSGGVTGAAAVIRAGATSRVVGGWREIQPGGMLTGGLGQVDASDETQFSGMSLDYLMWCNEYVGRAAALLTSKSVQPKHALLYLDYLIRKYRINQHWSKGVASATKDAQTGRLKSFTTSVGQTATFKGWEDQSYEGDLLAAVGVGFTVGREAQDASNPYNGNRGTGAYTTATAGISEHQFTATTGATYTGILTVDPYVTPGNAASGLLPGIQSAGPGTTGAADGAIQAYNFRMTATDSQTSRFPIAVQGSPPPGYSAQTYELLGRYIAAITAAGYTAVGYKTTPGANQFNLGLFVILNGVGSIGSTTIYDLNANNGFSTDTFGANWGEGWASIMRAAGIANPSANYAVGTYAEREIFWKWQENFQRGKFYFLAYSGDSRIPAQIASDAAIMGIDGSHYLDAHENDQPGWMTQLYVREARRMTGLMTLEASDVTATDGTAPRSLNTIGVGSYPIDSHHVRRFVDTSTGVARVINEGNIFSTVGGNRYFPTAIEYFTPKASDCTNGFATFAASARHTGFGALRMEMALMLTAEATGIAMAQVVKQAAQPDVQTWIANNYASDIRPALLAAGINAPQTN